MKGLLFKITTYIESIATREEKAELPLQLGKASPRDRLTCLLLFQ
jgi:hypothetical protein